MAMKTCACGHTQHVHTYFAIIGLNVGRCLAKRCRCLQFKTTAGAAQRASESPERVG